MHDSPAHDPAQGPAPTSTPQHGWPAEAERVPSKQDIRWSAFAEGPPANSDIRLTLPARPENVTVVRHLVGALADALAFPPALADDLRLAVTEACTNVVRHAYQDGKGPIEVVIRPADDALHVIVADRGTGIRPNSESEGPGLGLPLISSLTDALKIDHDAQTGSRLRMTFRRDRHRRPAVHA